MNGFSKKTLTTFMTSVGIFGVDIIILVLLSRILGPEGKGIYSLTLLIPSLMITFGDFGIATSNVYFVGSKKHKIEDIVSNSFFYSFFIGLALITAFFFFLKLAFFDNFMKTAGINSYYIWLVVLTIPVSLLSSMLSNIVRGKEEISNYNKISIIQAGVQLLAIILFLVFLGEGIFGAVLAYAISIIGSLISGLYFINKMKMAKLRLSFNFKIFKDSAVYGMKVYFANILSFLNYRLDMLIIAVFLNPVAVGIYSISVGMAEKLFIIPGAVSTVLFPRISSIQESEANKLTIKAVRQMLLILVAGSVVSVIIARPVIRILFGSVFLPSFFPFLLLLPGIIAFAIGGTLAADLCGRGKPQYAIYSSITCLVINISLNILLIPKWGVNGAAVASSIGYWADTIIIIWAFARISRKSPLEFLIIKKEDIKESFYFTLILFKNIWQEKN